MTGRTDRCSPSRNRLCPISPRAESPMPSLSQPVIDAGDALPPEPGPRPIDHLAVLGNERGRGRDAALVLRSETLSHDALNFRVDALAAWLANEVSDKGARVASWAAKGELTCLMPLAAARAGLVHVPINPLLKTMPWLAPKTRLPWTRGPAICVASSSAPARS